MRLEPARRPFATTAAALVLAMVAGCSSSGDEKREKPDADPAPSPSPAAGAVPEPRIAALTDALTSGDPDQLAVFLTAAQLHRQRGNSNVTGLLPEGAKLALGPGVQTKTGEIVRVPVTLEMPDDAEEPGQAESGRWLLLMAKQGGQWRLVGTAKQ